MLAGDPPFVLSDGFPGDLLPVPVSVRLQSWPSEYGKAIKRVQWVSRYAFDDARRGRTPQFDHLVLDSPIRERARTRNTLQRSTDRTGTPGSLFTLPEYYLDPGHPSLAGTDWLSIYVRLKPGYEDLFLSLLAELAATGFGSDASVGLGAFRFPMGQPMLEPAHGLDDAPDNADSLVVLSTFQPGATDPCMGLWETFTKFGKLGPDFGLSDVRKHPLILMRPGAIFRSDRDRPFLGRAIPMEEVLPPDSARALHDRGTTVVHPAFGLCIRAALSDTVVTFPEPRRS